MKNRNLEDLGEEKRISFFFISFLLPSLKIVLCEFENISCFLVPAFWLRFCSRMQHEIVVMGTVVGARVSQFMFQLFHLARYLSILCLSYLAYKMGILVVPVLDGCYED